MGLGERLEARAQARVKLLSVQDLPLSLFRWLRKHPPELTIPPPDWVIGAGHRTHLSVLYCRRLYSAKTVILMKPSLPLGWFDACIMPFHDRPPQQASVLATEGVLNTMTPQLQHRSTDQGVILIGGYSQHYGWDSETLCKQVAAICSAQENRHWLLSTSRRTPDDFLKQMQSSNLPNLTLIPAEQTPQGWVREQLESAAQVWVTRDSVSMVFESLTAAAPTGLLPLPDARKSRVVKSMNNVLEQGRAKDFDHWDLARPLPPMTDTLWEADRAARWLLQRFGVKPLSGATS